MDILKKFIVDDVFRLWTKEIQTHEGYIFTGNGYRIIRKKGSISNPKNEMNIDDKKKVAEYFNTPKKETVYFDSKELKDLLKKYKTKDKYKHFTKKCPECSGTSKVQYRYDSLSRVFYEDFDCPVCHGDGEIEIKPPKYLGKEFDYDPTCLIFYDVFLNPVFIEEFAECCDKFSLSKTEKLHIIGQFDDYEFVIMPKLGKYRDAIDLNTIAQTSFH